MLHRNDNMLLRIAQADAFAAAVEYVKRDEHPELFEAVERFDSYQQHPTHIKLKAGCYSDDTQMSIAVAEALIDSAGIAMFKGNWEEPISRVGFANYFFNAFKRDPRDGYSRAFQEILEQSRDADHMLSLIRPDSNKNGACMRAVPLGVISDPHQVKYVANTQASITHATWGGVSSAAAVALMSHFALYDGRGFDAMLEWGFQHHTCFEYFRRPWMGPVTGGWKTKDTTGLGVGMNTAWAVHTLLVEETSLAGIMRRLIKWGGDTDSVAAIAWGIASCRYQNEILPEFLERDLEARGNLKYGPNFLKRLGYNLMEAYV